LPNSTVLTCAEEVIENRRTATKAGNIFRMIE
jgi:hypothetical protein